MDNALVVFQDKKIRKIWFNDEWWFSVVDVVEALTDSPSPRQYWGVLKGREGQLLTFCLQLKLQSSDDKYYSTDCANLGEAATTEITRNQNVYGFDEGKKAAKEGGAVAGRARKDLELKSGRKVVTSENYVDQPETFKKLEKKKQK